jgi:hypothetical protein
MFGVCGIYALSVGDILDGTLIENCTLSSLTKVVSSSTATD